MARHYYVSQAVLDQSSPPRQGALHFTTPDEAKARAEAAQDPQRRFLFVFENGRLVVAPLRAPEFLRMSAERKEAQRYQLERQAAAAG